MENIFSFCIRWLTDDVYAIREIGCKLIKKLYDLFKCEEFEKRLIEKLNEMKSNGNYLIRNTVIMLGKVIDLNNINISIHILGIC
jgi:hypothetical protein